MARRRAIDPNIWQSEDFSNLSIMARVLFIGMFSLADDFGKGRGNPKYLKSVVFPYDDELRLIDVNKALSEIGTNMSVTFYDYDGNAYYRMDNWTKWQRVDHPTPSTIPNPNLGSSTSNGGGGGGGSDAIPESFENHSRIIPESFENHSCLKEVKLKEVKLKEKEDARASAPLDFPQGDDVLNGTEVESPPCESPPLGSRSRGKCAKAKPKPPPLEVPEHLADIWDDYLATRDKKRAAKTHHALDLILLKLQSLAPGDPALQRAILEQSIVGGWTDVYELHENRASKGETPETRRKRINDYAASEEARMRKEQAV